MKILHVITGLEKGGAEGVLARLVQFDSTNTHIIISLTDIGYWGEVLRSNGLEVITLDMPRGRLSLSGLFKLYKSICRHSPDAIQTWMYHADLIGGVIGRLAGVKNIVWGIRHSNLDPEIDSRAVILIAKLCSKLSTFIPRKIVSCSAVGAKYHVSIGYDQAKMIVIPNGYDFSRFVFSQDKREAYRQEWNVSDECFVFGLIARWNPQKNHHGLLESLHKLKNDKVGKFHCVLAGSNIDSDNQELMKLINRLELQDLVTLLGCQDDIPGIMSALDLHVLPSLSGEGFPNVVAEAMACETLCLVTDVGDAALIVDEFGWVSCSLKVLSIETSLLKIMEEHNNNELWNKKKLLASAHVNNHYSINKMCCNFISIWQNS